MNQSARRTTLNRLFYLNHSPINFHFNKNSDNFVVKEIPLYEWSDEGEHLILKIRKKDLTTWEMLKILSKEISVNTKEFGYAGLKDKDGLTTQFISINKKYQKALSNFSHPNIKILSTTYHKNKIKTGHLKGNRFFIRLKKVNKVDAQKLKEAFNQISKNGFANYFGYQRFGKTGNNYEEALKYLKGEKKIRDKRVKKFLISAYQSHLFNLWLSKRVEIAKLFNSFDPKELNTLFNFPKETIKQIKSQPHFFKMLPGELCHHYPHGRVFIAEDLEVESERFFKKEITITGLLVGKRVKNSTGIAANFEKDIAKEAESFVDRLNGSRRFAWVWANDMEFRYKEEEAWVELNFTLPKGSYATVLLEELTHSPIRD
jgi:tRNA pseudouridine13 synthase